jgi:hypothetical protein
MLTRPRKANWLSTVAGSRSVAPVKTLAHLPSFPGRLHRCSSERVLPQDLRRAMGVRFGDE